MAWFPDLSALTYHPESQGLNFIAVGWLSSQHDFVKGPVSPKRFERLCELLRDPWKPPFAYAGLHRCEFCRFTGGSVSAYKDYKISGASTAELFIPVKGGVFVSPVNIAHYIDAHTYCPPEEFWGAVENCPPMKSTAYLKSILDGGVQEWLARLKADR